MNIRDILSLARPVMPVIVLDRVEDAVPLAQRFVHERVRVLEITLRTPAALEGVRRIRAAVPSAIVGVGTILTVEDLTNARQAGAAFGVSPGVTPSLLAAARASGWPFLPGVATPSEVMLSRDAGFTAMKLFPAAAVGGAALLKALAGPFPDVIFCPTGGIDAGSAAEYLALPNVACVGGSWVVPSRGADS